MSSSRRGAAVLLAVVVAATGAALPTVATAAPGVTTVMTILGSGGYMAGFETSRYTAPQLSVRVSATAESESLRFYSGSSGADLAAVFLESPPGQPRLTVGRYSSSAVATVTSAALTVSRSYRGCSRQDGSFEVLSLARDAAGALTSVAVDFQVTCDSDLRPTRGSLRWNSSTPYRHTAPSFTNDVVAVPGVPVLATATMTNEGTSPTSMGPTRFTGATGALAGTTPVAVVGDGCAGTTLQPGGSCRVQVSISAVSGSQTHVGYLLTDDGSLRGAVYTPVRVVAGRSTEAGTFTAVDPVRVLDTRGGPGGRTRPLGQQETVTVEPALGGAIPTAGVSAVLLNVTGTGPTGPTHLRVWPTGTPLPGTSSLNLVAGQDRANQVVVPLGPDGRVALFNNAGSTHVVVDVQGFYSRADGAPGGGYHPITPSRVLDTREDEDGPLSPAGEYWVSVGALGVDRDTVTAVDVNLTVTEPTTPGHVTAWTGEGPAPSASNLNFAPGQTVANHAVLPVVFDEVTGEPLVRVRNSNGNTHLIVDVQGYYDDGVLTDGLRFTPSRTSRVADTRTGGQRVAAGGTLVVPGSSLPTFAVAHVVNITSTASTGPGHLTAWRGDVARPSTSTLNYARGEDSPNLATVRIGSDGRIAVGANSSPSHVVVDHLGIFW